MCLSRIRPTQSWDCIRVFNGSSKFYASNWSHCCLARMVRADMHACGEPHEVYCQKFWRKHWGHPNPKHSIMWSTSPLIRMLYLGKLIGDQRRSQYKSAVAYKDSRGRKKYKGTKDLKRTGLLVLSTLHVFS